MSFGAFVRWLEDTALTSVKTYMAKPGQVEKKWWVVDATGKSVGRLASDIAVILMGKHRPTYTPHIDTGDFVIVLNVDKVEFTGKKWTQKTYTRYTGYPGLRTESAEKIRDRAPERILHMAVRRMLPKNKLANAMLSKLKLYTGTDHPHQAQQPEAIELG
ncbi:MAG: 50S ribosomal protein L13 [Planctomycetales bacterium]|nr:50S ribosomal protein L13 [Planctomycetales bacterium]